MLPLTPHSFLLLPKAPDIQSKIAEIKEMITQKEAEIIQTKTELDEAIVREETQYQNMKVRIKNMGHVSSCINIGIA